MTGRSESALRQAWERFRRHASAFLLAELAVILAWVALELAVVCAYWLRLPPLLHWPIWACLHLAFFWVFCGIMAGMHALALAAVDGDAGAPAAPWHCLHRGATYLGAALLYWAAVIFGLALAVVPGVMLATRWAMFRFVALDPSQSARSSLEQAAGLSRSRRWRVFRMLAVSAALNLAGAAVLGLGLLLTYPVTLILRAAVFRSLQQDTAAALQGNHQ